MRRNAIYHDFGFSPGDRDLGFASRWFELGRVSRQGCFSPGDRDLGFASYERVAFKRLDLAHKFQSRRSGFGVCVQTILRSWKCNITVSVPAIGIWGLRHLDDLCFHYSTSGFSPGDRDLGFASPSITEISRGACCVSVPAIGIWGLRRLPVTCIGWREQCFSPGDRDLGFASRSLRSAILISSCVSVPAIGIWGLRPCLMAAALLAWLSFSPGDRDLGFASVKIYKLIPFKAFQSRRSRFGVCVLEQWLQSQALKESVSVPAIGIWGLRPLTPDFVALPDL